MHEVPRAKGGGFRKTTLADARKLGLLPSVTTVLRALDKPALTHWLIEQAVNAVLTAPRMEGEELDAFKERVLVTEAHQEEEGQIARDLGTDIHDAMEKLFMGEEVDPELMPYIEPAAAHIHRMGTVVAMEKTVVGPGYAGRVDLVLRLHTGELELLDYKTTKKLPTKEAWAEHRIQCAAYAKAWREQEVPGQGFPERIVSTSNLYISTQEQGKFNYCLHVEPWPDVYDQAFAPLLAVWQWMNQYKPS